MEGRGDWKRRTQGLSPKMGVGKFGSNILLNLLYENQIKMAPSYNNLGKVASALWYKDLGTIKKVVMIEKLSMNRTVGKLSMDSTCR